MLVWMTFGTSSFTTSPSSWLGMGNDVGLSLFSGNPAGPAGTEAVSATPSVSVLFILLRVSVVGVIGDVTSLASQRCDTGVAIEGNSLCVATLVSSRESPMRCDTGVVTT